MSAADKLAIVTKHNDLRRKVAKGLETQGKPGPQPSAANMREMKWDASLASAAQTLANRCVWAHDTKIPAGKLQFSAGNKLKYFILHSLLGTWTAYGQNLAGGSGTWAGMVQMWYDEVKAFNSTTIPKYV